MYEDFSVLRGLITSSNLVLPNSLGGSLKCVYRMACVLTIPHLNDHVLFSHTKKKKKVPFLSTYSLIQIIVERLKYIRHWDLGSRDPAANRTECSQLF